MDDDDRARDRPRLRPGARAAARQGAARAAGRPRPRHAPDRARRWPPALRDGLVDEGATVLDAGHGRDRDALPPGRLARARRRRDGHRLAQPEGLHRRQAGPRGRAGALRRRRDRRRPRRDRGRAAGAARRRLGRGGRHLRRLPRSTPSPSSTPTAVKPDEGRGRRRQRDGRADGRPAARAARPRAGDETYWEPDGEFPDHEPNPLLRGEPADASSSEVRGEGADLGDRLGRRRRPLLLHRRRAASSATATSSARCSPARPSRKEPGATILYDPRSSRAVPDTVAAEPAARSDLTRVGHAFFKIADARDGRGLRRRGLRPLLLPRLLVRRLGDDPGAARCSSCSRARAARSPS